MDYSKCTKRLGVDEKLNILKALLGNLVVEVELLK